MTGNFPFEGAPGITDTIFGLAGGIGLFLLGMSLLTDGLKSFAGEALRQALIRFTGSPRKAFASGALATAIVQSSSATTVTVIGFVSAGLLNFPQAVGVVIGASLGTTSTGWIVSGLGLKMNVGLLALPLVGLGAFMKLLARGRWRHFGLALAGFGLIFIGIETLQAGMKGLSGFFRFTDLPSTGFFGHVGVMLIGLAMTLIMQSSSAAVATTLTALHSASINFEQAASLVIGAAIGTTVTGALAAIGASVSTKRTALAHILFNLATGFIAITLLPLFLMGIQWAQKWLGLEPGATSLAAFHTAFMALGVGVFLPFIDGFARWIERVLPEKKPVATRHLDPTLLHLPAVALEATRRALEETAAGMVAIVEANLMDGRQPGTSPMKITEFQEALGRIQHFFAQIPPLAEGEPLSRTRVAQMHAIDHLVRLREYLSPPQVFLRLYDQEDLKEHLERAREILGLAAAGLKGAAPADWLHRLERKSFELSQLHRKGRSAVLWKTGLGGKEPALALDLLDAMRWLDRLGYHVWRTCAYLEGTAKPLGPIDASGQNEPQG